MAIWSSVGGRGTNTAKASGTTLTLSPNANVPVGAVLVLWVGWDNNNNSTITGPMGSQFTCGDDAGNWWATCFEAQDAGQQARAHGAMFICQLQFALTTSSVITVTHLVAAWIAKACSLHEFALPDGYRFAAARAVDLKTRAADPGAITISGLESREWLFLHALAAEAPSTDAYTWDADYTQITAAGTTGGVADSNMTILGGYRIATLTGDTVDVQSDTADRDYTQGLTAMAAYQPQLVFPTTPILDEFNRANENPLANGTWTSAGSCSLSINAAGGNLQILSNVVGTTTANQNGQLWTTIWGTNDQEAYVTLITAPTSNGDDFGVVVCGPEGTLGHPCSTVSADGYYAVWQRTQGSTAGPRIALGNGGASFSAAYLWVFAGNPVASTKIGVQRVDRINTLWVDTGGGWYRPGFAWISNQYTNGRVGLAMRGTVGRTDSFGGGGFVQPQHLLPLLHVGA